MAETMVETELHEQIRRLEESNQRLKQNEYRLEALLALSQLPRTDETELREYALESVVALTGSQAGYLHFVNEDNNTIDLICWSKSILKSCTAEKQQHYPIDKAGIWADSVRLRKPVVHNDYQNISHKKGYPEGHFHLIRHLGVPIFDQGKIVAVAGVGNKKSDYTDADVRQMLLFMNNLWSILKQKKAESILRQYSMEDSLTGLANRRRLDEVMEIEWRRALRQQNPLSLVMLDVDNFKLFNDIYGHPVGDECLKKIAACMRQHFRRAGELSSRYGGEEFCVVLPLMDLNQGLKAADSLRWKIRDMKIPHAAGQASSFLTISAGVASCVPTSDLSLAELLQHADRELYKAKESGRNIVRGSEIRPAV